MSIDIFESFIVNNFPDTKEQVLKFFTTCLFPKPLESDDWYDCVIYLISNYVGKHVLNQNVAVKMENDVTECFSKVKIIDLLC